MNILFYLKVLVKIFNSILDFVILSDFKMSTVIFARGDSLVGFQPAKIWASLAPPYTHIKCVSGAGPWKVVKYCILAKSPLMQY